MFEGVKVEKGVVEKKVKTEYEVKGHRVIFTQESLEDTTPTTYTNRELFNWLGGALPQG